MVVVTVTVLRFTNNLGTVVLDSPQGWMDFVVGFNAELNIVAEARGAAFIDMPNTLPVDLKSRSPNRSGGRASLATMLRQDLSKHSDVGGGVTRYQLSGKSWDGLPFRADTMSEVATVVRKSLPGSRAFADSEFRKGLNYVNRGSATQPFATLGPTGAPAFDPDSGDPSSKREVPSAATVTAAGGLEVLEAQVPAAPERKVTVPAARALVRSPADVWFYSGHGLPSGELAVGPLNGHSYAIWATPQQFVSNWISSGNKDRTSDMRILIINGCNVLNLDPANGAPGKEWAKLMQARGGNFTHILGYAAKAPLDTGGGADIAFSIGRAIRRGEDLVNEWLKINASPHRRWGAVAMDAAGYHAFDPTTHKPAAPQPLP